MANPNSAGRSEPLVTLKHFHEEFERQQRHSPFSLHQYQEEGVAWLHERHFGDGYQGCLLADEMGLGKTVQVTYFLSSLIRKALITKVLIVAPPTLVTMWQEALLKFGACPPQAIVLINQRSKAQREKLWETSVFGNTNIPTIALTSYGIVRQDREFLSVLMAESTLDYAVLDEAQSIKDPSSQIHNAVVQHLSHAKHRLALTGTPIMNDLMDLWSIFSFLDPQILGVSRAELKRLSKAVKRGNERDASAGERQQCLAKGEDLKARFAPYVLRREKNEIQNLLNSKKTDIVLWAKMTPVQTYHYKSFLNSESVQETVRHFDTKKPFGVADGVKENL